LDSIRAQDYQNFQVVIVDDGSTDGTYERILEWLGSADDRFSVIRNDVNLGSPIGSIVKAIDSVTLDKEDIIVNVDGDDWLPGSDVFSHLDKVYRSTGAWMTYGQFEPASKAYSGICAKVPNTATYRRSGIWYKKMYASHLRTYKKKIFDLIKREDFLDLYDRNKYMQLAADMPLIFALLEICGNKRAVFIKKVMYVYNDENSLSSMYKNPKLQVKYARMIARKEPYGRFSG
jgi:glycosyltransferase involved in cell wall biosynthesis